MSGRARTQREEEELMTPMDEARLDPTAGSYAEFDPQNVLDSYRNILSRLIRKPAAFFGDMPIAGGFLNPTLFLMGCLLMCGFLSSIRTTSVWHIVRVPVLGTMSIYMHSFILYFFTRRLFEGKGTYEATFRTVAYTGAVFLVMWVPVLALAGFFFGLYLLVLGTERVHLIERSPAVAAVILSAGASLILLLLFGFWRVGLVL
jgi:hypothetical protein